MRRTALAVCGRAVPLSEHSKYTTTRAVSRTRIMKNNRMKFARVLLDSRVQLYSHRPYAYARLGGGGVLCSRKVKTKTVCPQHSNTGRGGGGYLRSAGWSEARYREKGANRETVVFTVIFCVFGAGGPSQGRPLRRWVSGVRG